MYLFNCVLCETKIDLSLQHNGLVAQLNRAPDYGSGGLRFESLRGHNIQKPPVKEAFLFSKSVLKLDKLLHHEYQV
jgi:hypothetical protein